MIQNIRYAPKPLRTVLHYARLIRTFKNWRTYLEMKRARRGEGGFDFETRSGLSFTAPAKSQQVFKDIFLYDCYSFRALFSDLPENPLIIDLGANVGLFSLFAFSQMAACRCISVEPFPGNFRLLSKNQKSNPHLKWNLLQGAAGESDGTIELFAPEGVDFTPDASVIRPEPGREGQLQRIPVECVSLSTLFSRFSVDRCDWLKIDCEGAEYDILYSCADNLLAGIDAISMETHHVDDGMKNLASMARFLESKGFDSIHRADDQVIHARRSARINA